MEAGARLHRQSTQAPQAIRPRQRARTDFRAPSHVSCRTLERSIYDIDRPRLGRTQSPPRGEPFQALAAAQRARRSSEPGDAGDRSPASMLTDDPGFASLATDGGAVVSLSLR